MALLTIFPAWPTFVFPFVIHRADVADGSIIAVHQQGMFLAVREVGTLRLFFAFAIERPVVAIDKSGMLFMIDALTVVFASVIIVFHIAIVPVIASC